MSFFLFRLYIFFQGVRFYRMDTEPVVSEFRSVEFKMVCGRELSFHFYREIYNDFIFKHGKVKQKKFTSFIIRAEFSHNMPEAILKFNNMKIVFRQRFLPMFSDDQICRYLLSIFLDFLENEINTSPPPEPQPA